MQSAMIHHYCLFTLQMDSRGIWAVRSGARTLSASTIHDSLNLNITKRCFMPTKLSILHRKHKKNHTKKPQKIKIQNRVNKPCQNHPSSQPQGKHRLGFQWV